MPLLGPRPGTGAAAALVRAGLLDDPEAGILIMRQNGIHGDRADDLVMALTGLAVRTLLAANGYDVAKTVKVIDQWIGEYARQEATEP